MRRGYRAALIAAAAGTSLSVSGISFGAEVGGEGGAPDLQIHGFVSPGYILTTANNYLAKTEHGSFEFTEAGVNLTMPVTDRLRTGVQFFGRKLGSTGNYSAKLDWFYLDYHWQDWLGFRAGRVKLPFGLYNDTSDIDAARVPILLPQSIYPATNRDFLLAQTGGEFYGRIGVPVLGDVEYRAYGGTISLEAQSTPQLQVVDLNVPYLVGGRVLIEPAVLGLRFGASLQALELDSDIVAGTSPATVKLPAILWVASAEYSAHEILVAAEYSRWDVRLRSSDPAVFPESYSVSERAYLMASWRVTAWFSPGVYGSIYYPDVGDRSANGQNDVAATLRFDINPWWLVKLEGHYMNGTAGLNSALNGGIPLTDLKPDWGVFLVKTTAHF